MSFNIAYKHGRIIKAMDNLKSIEAYQFTEKDLRGLTPVEKDYIRNNGYGSHVDIRPFRDGKPVRYYMFIARDLHGKKHLYALSKSQVLAINGHDICPNAYNYECWLIFNNGGFDRYHYERRFCETPTRTIFCWL